MALFVLSSKDGWVNIMYTGLDAVGVDIQPIENYNEWRLLYFISFLLLVAFFVLNMFVGVVVENFHRCREEQEKEERARRMEKRAKKLEKRRKRMREPPYYIGYGPFRMSIHSIVTNKYFDVIIAAVIGLNVVTMSLEYYEMPMELDYALKLFNFVFTGVFMLELMMKLYALGIKRYMSERWNRLDVLIVILSIVGILLEEIESNLIPINPTIIRVMRVARIARVLKLLKMATGMRALLNTVMQALPQVGNLGLLFFLLFFIFAALGVELFGRLECDETHPCQGMSEHAHFQNFGIAFLTLFRVATGDNWNGIMKDTLRDECDPSDDCLKNCCTNHVIAPLYFVVFVLLAQFVLVNVVVAVLMKHLEESHKYMEEDEDYEIDMEIARELEAEKKALEEEQERKKQEKEAKKNEKKSLKDKQTLSKVLSLPSNFTFTFASEGEESDLDGVNNYRICVRRNRPMITLGSRDTQSPSGTMVSGNTCGATSAIPSSRSFLGSYHYLQAPSGHSPTSPKVFQGWDDDNSSFNNLSPTTTKESDRKYSDTGMSIMDEESANLSQYLIPSYPEFCKLNIITKSAQQQQQQNSGKESKSGRKDSSRSTGTERKSLNSSKSWDQVSYMGQKDGSSLSSISTDNSMTMDADVERIICYKEPVLLKDDSQEEPESQVDNELLLEQTDLSESPRYPREGVS